MNSGEVTGIVCVLGSVFAFFNSPWLGLGLFLLGIVLLVFGKHENKIEERLDVKKGVKK